MTRTRVVSLAVLLCLTLVLAGCAGSALSWLLPLLVGQAAESSRVIITPANPTVPPGGKINFNVRSYSILGNPVPIVGTAVWSVTGAIGTIGSSSGEFTAFSTIDHRTSGVVTVNVRSFSGSTASASTQVTVDPAVGGELVALSVFPEALTLAQGQQMQFVAVPTDANGVLVTENVTILWPAVDPTFGTMTTTGLFTAASSGSNNERTVQLQFTARKGTAQVSTTVPVTVKPPTTVGSVAAVVVAPSNVKLYTGDSLQFVVVASDKDGNFVPVTDATWETTGNIGTISSSGVLTAGQAPATGTVAVTSGTKQHAEANVQVVARQ